MKCMEFVIPAPERSAIRGFSSFAFLYALISHSINGCFFSGDILMFAYMFN